MTRKGLAMAEAEIPEIPEIPEKLPISGKKGSEKLNRLCGRAKHLQQRIDSADRDLSHDKAELAALKWVIKQVIMYENLLKKGPDEDPSL